jgi:hypothetical protein
MSPSIILDAITDISYYFKELWSMDITRNSGIMERSKCSQLSTQSHTIVQKICLLSASVWCYAAILEVDLGFYWLTFGFYWLTQVSCGKTAPPTTSKGSSYQDSPGAGSTAEGETLDKAQKYSCIHIPCVLIHLFFESLPSHMNFYFVRKMHPSLLTGI